MGKVISNVSMSLDGFITAANARPEAGLGDDGEQLHEWVFSGSDPRNHEIMKWYATVGVNIFGRTGYNHSILYWGADGPSGAARIPTIIVSHSVPENIPANGVYTFVDSIEAALETAKKLADDKDIYITGANVAQQFLKLGLIDEIVIHLVPVVFGSGTRLFEGIGNRHIQLEVIDVVKTAEAIHHRFRVIK
jgi:dihydrofolate reductase